MGAGTLRQAIIWIVTLMTLAVIAAAQSSGGAAPASAAVLPKDIDPESLSRLPLLKRSDLDEEGKRVYDLIAGGPDKTVVPTGPVPITLYSPKLAEGVQMLNQYLRFHGLLSHRDSEVAILVAAREYEQQYEWSAHVLAARAAMVPEPVIDVIKYNKDTTGLGEKDALIITFGHGLFHQHKVDSDLYAKAVATFGKQGTVELAGVFADYALTAIILIAVDQHSPPSRQEMLPAK